MKEGENMKLAVAIESFYDMEREKNVTVGDEFIVSEERYSELSTKDNGAQMVLVKEVKKTNK